MGSKTPTTTEQKQVQTSAPPSWMQNVFKRGGADAYQMYNTGVGGNVYGGPRVAPLSAPTYQAIGGLGNVPHQYQSYMNHLMNTPTSSANNLGRLASGGMMGGNSHFSQVLQEGLDEVENRVNRYFSGIGRYGTPDHKDELRKASGSVYARAMSDQYDKDWQRMMQANSMIDQFNQNRLGMVGNLFPAYNNAYTNMLQGSGILNDYNQRLVDANRERWLEQDNSGWNRLNMLMNAGHGFARNYGTTTNNNTTSMIEGNNPWKNFAAVANLATSFMGIPDISKPFGAFLGKKLGV
ncbi:hypothetical protein [Bartonella krasnovii]|uniref:Phage protein n=1 Tax=Bartonella krasnovii TaxID=2267275 RepID=A0A5B9D1L3_9HYPH|nr:hypothetical protein [Bartonella krasnovii]QEE12270.1 phage protein [Bartonella krasnovii]UNF29791.1 hypothetical protein MNL13_03270 [Bartonella krasnovii]UNF36151.1 hypothetical protein MNL12_03265 [Bartonella krasnovii]UNF37858.1 hypothetical protein MNL11_03795 [Bartonella krasnovii]UNF39647.1 hypothetical protein MNL10_04330 [Bartonella krasnovii]